MVGVQGMKDDKCLVFLKECKVHHFRVPVSTSSCFPGHTVKGNPKQQRDTPTVIDMPTEPTEHIQHALKVTTLALSYLPTYVPPTTTEIQGLISEANLCSTNTRKCMLLSNQCGDNMQVVFYE